MSTFECVYSLRYDAPTASCIVPAGSSNRPPFKSARQTFSCVKKLLIAGAPAACNTAIVFGSLRLKMLIGVQPSIGAVGRAAMHDAVGAEERRTRRLVERW